MQELGAYILSVTAASLICAVATGIRGKDSSSGKLAHMAAGLILLFTVIKPLAQLDISDPTNWLGNIKMEASEAVAAGEHETNIALVTRIKEQTEAYILDKAALCGAELAVEVILSDEGLPVPVGAVLQGNVSPYVKSKLAAILESELGFTGEDLIWN